jgi:AcrR family transcriptional regulator
VPRSPEDNQQIRDARRESILRAAEQVFAEKGFSFTKISDIASAAGLSHGLVYHYFDSKEALFSALIDGKMSRFETDLEQEGDSAYERLTRSLEASFGRIRDRPESMQLMTQAMLIGGLPDTLREVAFERARLLVDRTRALIEECQSDGNIVTDIEAEQITSVLVCIMRGMSIRPPGEDEMPFPMPDVMTLFKLLRPHGSSEAEQEEP